MNVKVWGLKNTNLKEGMKQWVDILIYPQISGGFNIIINIRDVSLISFINLHKKYNLLI